MRYLSLVLDLFIEWIPGGFERNWGKKGGADFLKKSLKFDNSRTGSRLFKK